MNQNLLPGSPVYRRKVRRTIEYWEYFQVGFEGKLQYLDKDHVSPKKVVMDGDPKVEIVQTWDEVKGPERSMALTQGIVNIEEI